jgi:NADH dehydrogenase FAD-containing subunit
LIVGGGFAGLAAAKALRNTTAQIILIDRTNHHLFQPLLYQVATSVLTPGQIASPIRGILRNQWNATVILGEVTGVDKEQKSVFVSNADRVRVGEVVIQMENQQPATYKRGQAWYEPPGLIHKITKNPDPKRHALFLAVIIGEQGRPGKSPV